MARPSPLLLLLLPALAHGAALRLCADVAAQAPFMTAANDGPVDRLVSAAAADAGVTLARYAAPMARCRQELRAGLADAYPMVAYSPALLGIATFPMAAGAPDASRAVSSERLMLYRRKGAAVSWDGVHIAGLRAPLLVTFGATLSTELAERTHLPLDAEGKSIDVNFAKLAVGRGDLALGYESAGSALLARPEFRDKIEALPLPFATVAFYLAVTNSYYAGHRAEVERLWSAIGQRRRQGANAPATSVQSAKAREK